MARIERDSMGEMPVPDDALYGAQTARAVANFPISGQPIGRELIWALGLIKQAAAEVNARLGLLDAPRAAAIAAAAAEVAAGQHDAHFPVDIFQTGSGTSSNMNANEVIAHRARQLLDDGTAAASAVAAHDQHDRPEGRSTETDAPPSAASAPARVHPNDHVNLGQSSNDVFPSAIHLAALRVAHARLLPALLDLHAALERKAVAFDPIVKIGRTHLQDATPIRLGQEFSGFAAQVHHAVAHLQGGLAHLRQLALGGTAVGTGLNTHPDFGRLVAARLGELSGLELREADNHFAAQASLDAAVQVSGRLKALAVSLLKIANDIRLYASGPRLGLGELILPAVQPGSSIMPGKVNPVIAEALIMVCAQVIGDDTAVTLGGLYSFFDLNVMQPLVARNLLEQERLLAAAVRVFTDKLLEGLAADEAAIAARNERSLGLATALVPAIGYDAAAALAKEAAASGTTIRALAEQRGLLPAEELARVLDLRRQTEPTGGPGAR